ncbi:kinesin-like protein KIFC3 isoform X4 [Sinocyclocheilus grahami]|uniref:kinesin-like protein KIFC3 isoform X4 n=1 Tax=Sinocyclocheilus grahami TaxID=75366 RepID=UPI0007AC6601|nr:PREDICTED: kinesin-like protein KIFC3 isoform X4 [Sinocyclocheilus grahami]
MVLKEVDSDWEAQQREQGSGQEGSSLLQVLPNIMPHVLAMQEQEDAETQTERWTPLTESIKKEAEETAVANIEERLQQERVEAAHIAELAVRQLEEEHTTQIIIDTKTEESDNEEQKMLTKDKKPADEKGQAKETGEVIPQRLETPKLYKAALEVSTGETFAKLKVAYKGATLEPVQRCGLLGPAVMYGTRKTWDVGHTPCLQELWNKDLSLDVSASSLDILMSDGEEESSFLSLPNSVLQRHCLTSDLSETATSEQQQLLIQKVTLSCSWTSAYTLQERVCEFQARLRSEDAAKRHLLQRLQTHDHQLNQDNHQNEEQLSINQEPQEQLRLQDGQLIQAVSPTGVRSSSVLRQRPVDFPSVVQVKELEEKLVDQTQEVERLRSELGATDLEKQLEVLESENQRLKQELRASQTQTTCSTGHCPHSQDVEALRGELCHKDEECRERERRLAALEQHVQERTGVVVQLQQQLEEAAQRRQELQQQLEEASRLRSQSEEQLTSRLRDAEEALSRQAALTPQVKYVTKTVEVESAQCKQALMEAQGRNQALQEQLSVQRQLLRELEQQLHESQRTSSQLRQQLRTDHGRLYGLLFKAVGGGNTEVTHRLSKILVYESEMERAQGQLEAEMQSLEEEKNRVIEEAFIRAESEMKAVHENLAGVRMNLLTLQPALRTLTCDYNCLKRQVQDFPYMLEKAITEAKQEICQVIGEVSSANQELLRKYKREMNLRKKCHNELVRLKGNIRVLCRVRPVCAGETDAADTKNIVTFDPDDDAVLYLSNKGKLMTFELDKVFPTQATQEEVFQEVQSLVTSCIDGFNVCIFAYGQTGSGKTYTMEGVPEDPGINQRALRLLFSEVSEKKPDWDYKITVSMVEIYNETLRNLLGDNPNEKLDIKMCPDGSGQLYVPGLTEFTVESVEDINKVFDLGHMNRATACTNLNEHSSRSHALLIVTVAGFNSSTGHRTSGKLNLVDLAGSERIAKSGAEGSRLREAQCINKSLSALGDVINALRSKHSHVPFRNSRLTYLLQDSLSRDSKTLMMVQVSPLESNVSESVCSLKFAQRVRTVEIGPSSSSRRHAENSSTSSSPTHDSVELDSPPVTPVPLPISRASSAGSTLSSNSKTPTTRRRSHSQLSTDRQVDRSSPLVGDGGQVGGVLCGWSLGMNRSAWHGAPRVTSSTPTHLTQRL